MGLALFRIYWGIVGSDTARFKSFLRGRAAILAYTRMLANRLTPPHPGHYPLGGWSALLLLLLILGQTLPGLFAVNVDGVDSGPLSDRVSYQLGRAIAQWHESLFIVLLLFILAHLSAILFYQVHKRQNLVVAMISGKRVLNNIAMAPINVVPLSRAILGIVLVCIFVLFIVLCV